MKMACVESRWGGEGDSVLKGKVGSRVIPRILPCERDGGGRQVSWGPLKGNQSLGYGRTMSSVWGMLTLRLPLRNSRMNARFRYMGVELREVCLDPWVLLSERDPEMKGC